MLHDSGVSMASSERGTGGQGVGVPVMVHKALLEATREAGEEGDGNDDDDDDDDDDVATGEDVVIGIGPEGGGGGGRRRGGEREHPRVPRVALMEGQHLFVFVHGFQGNQYDLRMMKNCLADIFPTADFLLSSSNETDTYSDIGSLGERLSREVS